MIEKGLDMIKIKDFVYHNFPGVKIEINTEEKELSLYYYYWRRSKPFALLIIRKIVNLSEKTILKYLEKNYSEICKDLSI